ncbi:GPP34 family phosphoprotein [Saccharomonospora sp. NPDC006951]
MLIAEDLLLLVFEDEEGKLLDGVVNLEYSLAGALLIELAMLGRIGVAAEDSDSVKAGRLVVHDVSPTGQAVLDDALTKLSTMENRKPKDVISPLSGGGLSRRLLSGLAERGVLREERGRVLGLFPVTRWPAEDSLHEERTRADLDRVLLNGGEPGERTGALIALLTGMSAVKRVVRADDPKAVERRAKEIAEGNWAGEAMRKAVEEVTAAVMVALFVPTIITAAS